MASRINALSSGTGGIVTAGDASGILQLQTANTAAVTIDGSQNVGIGTASPGSGIRLDVLGGEIKAGRIDSSSEGGQVSFGRASDNTTAWYIDAYGNTSTPSLRFVDVGAGAVSMGINSSGAVALRGAVSASGVGITFPSTQVSSSDANTLDDYEEGTFTVTAFGQSTAGTTTYSNQQGSYTKIGRQVTISIRLTYSALTGTGELRVGNFPFTVSNDSMEYIAPLITSNLNWGGGSYIQVYVVPNTTQAVLFHCSDDAGWGVQQCVNESAEIRFTATYFV
jgi:hypothetical protein